MEIISASEHATRIEDHVFAFEFQQLGNDMVLLTDYLTTLSGIMPVEYDDDFKTLLELMQVAYENRDYLLLADLVRYELLPIVSRSGVERSLN